jgi:DUF1680 family protein
MKILSLFTILVLLAVLIQAQSYVPLKNDPKFKIAPVIDLSATSFNLRDVKLLEGSIFKNAMDKDAAYLLEIDPNRLLHRFYKNAGLQTKGDVYRGWESEGLSGHTLGHYLSAISMFAVTSGNPDFKKRSDYIVDELERCQEARKTGYVGAIPNEDTLFNRVSRGVIKSGGFDLNGGWSPWYTVHKVMAGLVDAYLYCDNQKALEVVVKMADWANNIVKNLTEEQRLKMLNCEYGGMNDVLVNIYAITGNKKYFDLSRKFNDEFVMGQLAKEIDPMPGKHSNTNVPKAIGSARSYEVSNTPSDKTIASFFWNTMVHHHSYVIGGNSSYEYCGQEDKLNDRLSDNTCETCNTYNMLKLTMHLFCWQPSQELADYYERALYNHILASQNPTDGMMCYFVPLRMGTQKQFSDQFNTFTCCVGTGMENHSKYVESIYYRAKDGGLYVNLFIPSILNWKEKGITVKQETRFPESNTTSLLFSAKSPKLFSLYLRNPKWANDNVQIKVNGITVSPKTNESGYLVLNRKWSNNDKVEITLPLTLHTESMPDNPKRIAILYGPVVLAGQLGKENPDPLIGIPVLLTDDHNINNWIKPVENQPLTFKTIGVGKPFDPILKPFYSTYDQHYSVYFDFFTANEWQTRQAEYEAEKKLQSEIEANTVDNFRIGEMQPERDHQLQASAQSYIDAALGRTGREARSGNYFSFVMKTLPDINNVLMLTYFGDDKDRKFDILIDNVKLTTVDWNGGIVGKFYNLTYPIPSEMTLNKSKVTVRIEANYKKTAGRIFGCRIMKAK